MKAKQIADLTTATFSEDLLTNTLLSPRCHTTVLLFVLNVFLNEYLSKKMLLLFKHHLTLSDKMSSNNTLSCVITSNYTLIWPPSLFGEKVDIYMYIYTHRLLRIYKDRTTGGEMEKQDQDGLEA